MRFPTYFFLIFNGFLSIVFLALPVFGVTLSGSILEKGNRDPVLGGSLLLEAVPNTSQAEESFSLLNWYGPAPSPTATPPPAYTVEAGLMGNYEINVPAGVYRLVVAGEGYKKINQALFDLTRDRRKDFYLEREGFTLPEVVVTTDKTPPDQVSHEDLTREELTSVAGTVGDVMRAVQALPGVINAGMQYSGLLVRGNGPDDNLYLVDRIPIGSPFHFGGAISSLDSSLVKDLDFASGGLNPAFGNALGGLVDVTQRDPRMDHWGGRADLNLLMAEGEAEGPVTPDSSLVLAGRRSYLDLLIGDLNNSAFTAVPVFSDYQVKYSFRPSTRERWDFTALGSSDRVGVDINGTAAEQDPILGGNFNFTEGFDSQGINYQNQWDGQNELLETLFHSTRYFNEDFADNLYLNTALEDWGDWLSLRHEFDEHSSLEAGVQYDRVTDGTNAYFVVVPNPDQDPNFTATAAQKVSSNNSVSSDELGAYANQHFVWLHGRFVVSLGVRWDYLSFNSQSLWSPRLSAAYLLSDQTTLKGSYGFYEEAPSRIEGNTYLDPELGNPRLGAQQSIASVLGVDQKIGEGILLRVEGYEKDFSQLIVSDPVLNYSNEGAGVARGLEFFLRREPTERFFGWVSYSLGDSQRRDGPGLPLHNYDFDEPSILTVVAHYKLHPGWEVGLKWLYSAGLPFTPVTGAAATTVGPNTYDVPAVGPVNSARLPDYARLDLSTSITTLYDTWQWRVYLEIINALNNQDVLGYQYNRDYSQATPVKDLPFLPYIGFEAKY